jgi:hypothetical protein
MSLAGCSSVAEVGPHSLGEESLGRPL